GVAGWICGQSWVAHRAFAEYRPAVVRDSIKPDQRDHDEYPIQRAAASADPRILADRTESAVIYRDFELRRSANEPAKPPQPWHPVPGQLHLQQIIDRSGRLRSFPKYRQPL